MEHIMKYFVALLFIFSLNTFSMDHKKLDPIIFQIDLAVLEGKEQAAKEFTYAISDNVKKNEPNTLIYQYYFSPDNKKVFLYEVYKNNNAAVFHVEQFQGSDWEKEFFEIFELKDFQVLGNSEDSLKKVLDGFTNDFRTKEGGYHKVIEGLKSEILNLN